MLSLLLSLLEDDSSFSFAAARVTTGEQRVIDSRNNDCKRFFMLLLLSLLSSLGMQCGCLCYHNIVKVCRLPLREAASVVVVVLVVAFSFLLVLYDFTLSAFAKRKRAWFQLIFHWRSRLQHSTVHQNVTNDEKAAMH